MLEDVGKFTGPFVLSTVRFGPVGRVCRLPGLKEGLGKGSGTRSAAHQEGTIAWRESRAPDGPKYGNFAVFGGVAALLMKLLLTKAREGPDGPKYVYLIG